MTKKKRIAWLCGIPEQVRVEAFPDLGLPAGHAWSWVTAHLPPPENLDLHLICPDRRLKESVTRCWKGATFHLIKVPRGGSYLMYRGWIPSIEKVIQGLKPDVVHSWGTECGFAVAALHCAPRNHLIGIQGILAVTWQHIGMQPELMLNVINERSALKRARHCVAESEYSRRTVSRYTSAKVDVVPHPLRKEFLDAEPGPRNEKIIVYLGVLARRKGFFDAVHAFLSIPTDWTLVCIGTAPSIKEQKAVESFLRKTAAGDRVRLTGVQTPAQIIEWFRKSPVFLLPSYTDTGPTALKEALSMGLWPICYDNTGPKELIERYGSGTLVPTGDRKALAYALERVLTGQSWTKSREAIESVSRIRSDLAPVSIWAKLENVYNACAEKTESARANHEPVGEKDRRKASYG